jgi:RNA polymerase sigma factor (sigma-70 family)
MTFKQPAEAWPDDRLVRECLDGNNAAWAALIEKYRRLVASIPVKYQLPPEDAADIFQQVWIDLYRDLGRLERVEGLGSWLITAAARRCLLAKKRGQRTVRIAELEHDLADRGPDAAAIHAEAEREQKIREAIETLLPRCRKLVGMLFFDEPPRPYTEVARALGLALGSIGFIRGRCLAKLRTALEKAGL